MSVQGRRQHGTIPETVETRRERAMYGDPGTINRPSVVSALAAAEIVPELVGLSFAVVADGLTFTLVASASMVADLDAAQYLECARWRRLIAGEMMT